MTSGRVKGNVEMHTHLRTESLVRAEKTSEKILPGDWERHTSPLRPPDLLPPGDYLLSRESHTFPRADLGISGHIEKLEFCIITLVTAELECFSITGALYGSQSWREG